MATTTLTVQAASSHQYYGFYLGGFADLLGDVRWALRADVSPIPTQVQSGIGLEVRGRRIWIDAGDSDRIDQDALDWCDVYGVVNVEADQVARSPKIVPIGPGFGIRWGTAADTVRYVLRAARAEHSGPRYTYSRLRDSLAYHRQRLPLRAYERPNTSEADYLFYAGTLWNHRHPPPPARAHFVEAALGVPGVRFEGGLVASGPVPDDVDPKLISPRSYALDEYLERLSRSLCVMNTPAVWGCLGWKLGESLAMGKAVVTTPLDRVLPEPLEHGVHLHVVDDDLDDMRAALELLSRDDRYRRSLEEAARAYWERWLHPTAVARRLLEPDG